MRWRLQLLWLLMQLMFDLLLLHLLLRVLLFAIDRRFDPGRDQASLGDRPLKFEAFRSRLILELLDLDGPVVRQTFLVVSLIFNFNPEHLKTEIS